MTVDEQHVLAAIAARPVVADRLADNELILGCDQAQLPGTEEAVYEIVSPGGRAFGVTRSAVRALPGRDAEARLGRLLWHNARVTPGSELSLTPADAPEASSVTITPAFRLTPRARALATGAAASRRTLVWDGALVRLPTSPVGEVLFRIAAATPSPGRIGPTTTIDFENPDRSVSALPPSVADVGGHDDVLARLREMVTLPLTQPDVYWALGVRPPRGVILHGPPGTGKTLLCRAVAAELDVRVQAVTATELVGSHAGETEANLRALFDEGARHAPSLVIIDELDVLAGRRASLTSQSDIRAATQFLALLDGLTGIDGVVVLGCTNRLNVIDEAFRRPGRFDQEIRVGMPDAAGRRQILEIHTREMPLTDEAAERLSTAAMDRTAGFTGADLMYLAREVGLRAVARVAGMNGNGPAAFAVTADAVDAALRVVESTAVRNSEPRSRPAIAWNALTVAASTKQEILTAVSTALARTGPAEGLLLTGASGSGKSSVIAALAHELRTNLWTIDPATMFSQWLGETERSMRQIFAKAIDTKPSIVVIEHLDAIAPVREANGGQEATRRILAALLTCIDNATAAGGVAVVGVTDRPELVDRSVRRPGRLGQRINMDNRGE